MRLRSAVAKGAASPCTSPGVSIGGTGQEAAGVAEEVCQALERLTSQERPEWEGEKLGRPVC